MGFGRLSAKARGIPPASRSGAAQQALVRHVQTDHGDVRSGVEHAVGCLGILDHIRLGRQIPAVAFLGEGTAHHHQAQIPRDVRGFGDRHVDVGQRAGRHHGDVPAEPADLVDEESDAFRYVAIIVDVGIAGCAIGVDVAISGKGKGKGKIVN